MEINNYVFNHLPVQGVTDIVTTYNTYLIKFFKDQYTKYYNQEFKGSEEEQHINYSFFKVLDKCNSNNKTITVTANGQRQTFKQFKQEMEKHKKQVQTLTTYNGVNDPYASTFGGSTLMEYNKNFSSGSLFSNDGMGYTDLRQAYVESVIPVTQEDYQKMPKFKNIEEYKMHRNTVDVTPIDKTEAMRQLYNQNKDLESESAALAFHYAKHSEKSKKNNESFWSGLKQLTH